MTDRLDRLELVSAVILCISACACVMAVAAVVA